MQPCATKRKLICLFGFGILCMLAFGCAHHQVELSGFVRSPHFDEQVRTFTFDPDVTVHINAPSARSFDADRPTLLAIYGLPNGNTIAQTIGCQRADGLDWHFYIQHIGAQTRYLRQARPDINLVVAYVEAGGRSWPSWRKKHTDSGERIVELIETLKQSMPGRPPSVALIAHSGGGSMLFGYINAVDTIPGWIERIVWLDANYGYRDEDRHAEKLLDWLRRSRLHFLGVVAYDDREIELNGKKVVGPTGGTWRRTREMIDRFGQAATLDCRTLADRERCRGFDGRLDIHALLNPENKILHTVLVERNGFIHALTFGTPSVEAAASVFTAPAYGRWIQTGSALPGE